MFCLQLRNNSERPVDSVKTATGPPWNTSHPRVFDQLWPTAAPILRKAFHVQILVQKLDTRWFEILTALAMSQIFNFLSHRASSAVSSNKYSKNYENTLEIIRGETQIYQNVCQASVWSLRRFAFLEVIFISTRNSLESISWKLLDLHHLDKRLSHSYNTI